MSENLRPAPRSRPRVSVVIPCFNLGKFLGEAIESVLNQTFTDFEILVVDDGSTEERTRRVLDALSIPEARVLRSSNNGLSAARNLGVRHAAGDYVSALDADDRFEPTWLGRAVAFLDDHPDIAFVSHWLRTFGDERWDWKPARCDLGVLLDCNVLNGAAMFRRRLADEIGGFDESMREGCEDWDFWIRAITSGHRGAILPHVLYEYRRRAESMSRVMNQGDTHRRLYTSLVTRHAAAYSEHLLDLVLRREWTFARLVRQTEAAREDLARSLEPLLEERSRELAAAKDRLAALRERRRLEEGLEVAEAQRDEAHRVIGDLLQSRSWRMTAPLRRACERLGIAARAHYDE